MSLAEKTQTDVDRIGSFTYLTPSVENSLYRNGKVFTRRDGEGNDAPWEGADMETRQMPVHDARFIEGPARRTLAANGFELLERPMTSPDIDFLDHDQVVRSYYPQCAETIKETSGARLVAAFDHNIRSVSGNRSKQRAAGGQQVQPPLHMVHGDYTLTSAPQRLRDLAKPPTSNDTYRNLLSDGDSLLNADEVEHALKDGRFAIINLWRNIAREPVATNPLAFCDAARVHPEDLVVFEIHYAERVGENYYAKYSNDHRWYFYSALTREEAVLIQQWDSAGELARSKGTKADVPGPDSPCTFSFHSAFEDPAAPPDAPDRWSIEVRCAVLYD
jgi:hypothetical protein